MSDLLKDNDFLKLEKEYPLLARFRQSHDLENLPYVIVDTETTGLYPDQSEIIEIGAIKVSGTVKKEVFTSLIKPVSPIPPFITKITGIDDSMVDGKPGAATVLEDFLSFAEGHILVAHNADFDMSFLKYHMNKHLGAELNNKSLCTVKLSRAAVPGLVNYKLPTVAANFGIENKSAHRAMGDVEATFLIWQELIKRFKAKGITKLEQLDEFMK